MDKTSADQGPTIAVDDFVSKVIAMKESYFKFRWRRHNEWTENYTLYRDKVQLNRLTQRQSVNIPVIKSAIKTLLKDIDDPPILYFTNLDNDEQGEVYYNEHFKYTSRENKLRIKDVVDKRQVLLFGRSFKSLNIARGAFYTEIIDPQDMLIDRYIDPANFDSARGIIREHIYKPIPSLRTNPWYDQQAITELETKYLGNHGIILAEQNMIDWVEKNARMASLGLIDVFSPQLAETHIELNEVFIKEYSPRLGEDQIMFAVVADNIRTLFKAPLEMLLGETTDHYWRYHYPFTTWGDETERTDFWSDGVADTLRQLNKVMNAWFSQMVENRTLRNYGMNFFNSSLTEQGFTPQTFDPVPWGWYPMPVGESGKLSDNFMHVDIPDLEDTIEQMEYIQGIADKASAATTFQQGEQPKGEVTLGEVKLLLANAQERVKSMAVYYTDSWDEFGIKYTKLLEGSGHLLNPVTIHKKGRLTRKMYTKVVDSKDWQGKTGYSVQVQSQSEKKAEDMDALQWMNAARTLMQGNQPLDEMYKKKLLENANASSDEIQEILKADKQMQEKLAQQPLLPQTKPVNEAMNFKDIPPAAQNGMLKQANLPVQQQPHNPNNPLLPPGQGQATATNGANPQLQLPGPGMQGGAQ